MGATVYIATRVLVLRERKKDMENELKAQSGSTVSLETQGILGVARAIVKTLGGIRPERLFTYLQFLLPKRVRERYFEPYLEELKEDRILALQAQPSAFGRRFIEACYYFRLALALLRSFACIIGDLLAKLAPFLKMFGK
ncbi:MAG: hypothetical protein QM755_23745 [Luteolibacter sp.]